MEKRILNYRKLIDSMLEKNEGDWQELLKEHLIQIGFFQHERLIHLIVTVTFALMEIIAIVATVVSGYMWLFALDFVLMVLLVPYIRHYYILENEVQKMYAQYDKILERTKEEEEK